MKRLTLIVVASFLLSGSGYAQISAFPWTEGFENGTIPSGWTQEYVSGGMERWSVEDYFPHNGNYSAFFIGYSDITKLITPKLDLSSLTNPILRFWHLEPADYGWDMEQDTLKVYYKNSLHGAWILLGTYASGIFAYTEDIISLPNASNDYYIAFEGIGAYEIGIVLDDITIMDFANYVDVEIASIITPLATGINLTSTEQVKVVIKNNGSDPLTNFSLDLELDGTLIATEIYANTIASLSQVEYTFTAKLDLSAERNYTVKVTATAASDQDIPNNSKTKTVSNKICGLVSTFPYTEDFESETFDCWASYDIDGGGEQWEINIDYWGNGNVHSGVASAMHTYDCDDWNTEGFLVSPQLAIPANGSYVLEFWSINGDPEDYVYNGVWVSTTGGNPASSTFTEIKKLSGSEVSRNWKKIIIPLNAYAGQNIYIGFKYKGYCADIWYIDDIKIYDFSNYVDVEVASIVSPISGVNLTSTEPVKVLLNNNGHSPLTGFSLKLEFNGTTIATETYTNTIPSLGQAEYTFNAKLNLSAAGYYSVRVTATTANDQDNTNNSKIKYITNTICNPITAFPWEADLGGYSIPDCWTTVDVDGDGYSWEAFFYEGRVMSYFAASNSDNWLITPPLALNSDDYSLFFEVATPYADMFPIPEKYSVLVSTIGTNPNDFTTIHTEELSIIGDSKVVELPLNAYKGQTIYIAFRHWGDAGAVLELSNIRVDAHVGVASHTLTNDVRVYPNPSNGVVTVSVTENSTVRVLDVLGKVVDTYTVNGNSMLNFTQAAGFYFLQVESNGKISMHKLVIIKD